MHSGFNSKVQNSDSAVVCRKTMKLNLVRMCKISLISFNLHTSPSIIKYTLQLGRLMCWFCLLIPRLSSPPRVVQSCLSDKCLRKATWLSITLRLFCVFCVNGAIITLAACFNYSLVNRTGASRFHAVQPYRAFLLIRSLHAEQKEQNNFNDV